MNSTFQTLSKHLPFIFPFLIIFCSSSIAQISADDNNSMEKAQKLLQQRNFNGAIKIYDMIIAKDTDYVAAYVQRGLAKSYAGNNAGAIEDYSHAIQKNGNDISALWNRGTEYRLMGQYQESIADFNKALEIDSLSMHASELYENRGWAKYDAGEYKSSISDFTKAIYRNSKSAHSYYLRGKAKQKLNKLDEACEDWQIAQDLGYQFSEQEIEMFCKKTLR